MSSKSFQLIISFYIALVMVCYRPVVSFSNVEFLPGFSDILPFKLETGYIGVGDVEYFYYFIESERNPVDDPLVLWLTGGPGCTALSGLFFEIGPLQFNMVEYNGSLPTLALNPYSWTKVASIIFLDSPVGTGFSYSRTFEGFKTGDIKFAIDGYNFMRKWLQRHPDFITNPFYVAGDSYAGKIVPMIAQAISDGIEHKAVPPINIKGYLAGNPSADANFDGNSKVPFYHRMALISDELYQSAKNSCRGEYVEVDARNFMCAKDLEAISKCTSALNEAQILEPECPSDFIMGSFDNNRKIFQESHEDYLHKPAEFPQFGCRNYNCYLLQVWVTDMSVQKALHIRVGTVKEWVRCNTSLSYDEYVQSVLNHHLHLNTKGFRALIYSGDHDSLVPYVGTEAWIKSLNLSIVDDWRPWFLDGQVAGYTREYQNSFTFATIKGGGHTAPEFNPKECFAMFKRWTSLQPL